MPAAPVCLPGLSLPAHHVLLPRLQYGDAAGGKGDKQGGSAAGTGGQVLFSRLHHRLLRHQADDSPHPPAIPAPGPAVQRRAARKPHPDAAPAIPGALPPSEPLEQDLEGMLGALLSTI